MAIPEYPISRIEHYLARANGQNVTPPDPISRIEHYLAGIAGGMPQELLDDVAELKSHLNATEIVDTASGAIASFPDGANNVPVESLTVSMEPIQDLHGQDAPYPGGGGKNLLPTPTQETQTVNGVTVKTNDDGSITFSGTASTSTSINFVFFDLAAGDYILSNIGSNAASSGEITSIYVRDNTNGVTLTSFSLGNSVNNTVFTLTETVNIRFYAVVQSGATVSGALYLMIRRSGNGDNTFAPYSNICPISGRDSAMVVRTGVNVWDEEWELGGISSSGNNDSASDRIRSKNYIMVLPNTTYYVKSTNTNTVGLRMYDANKTIITTQVVTNNTYTMPSNCRYIRFIVLDTTTYNHDISINYPSTDHDYHPGTVASVEIPLGQTVYGGTLDVVSGVLTVDRAMVDLGSLNWASETKLIPGQFMVEQQQIMALGARYSPVICSILKGVRPKGYSQFNYEEIGLSNSDVSQILRARSTLFENATPADVKLFFAGQTLVYELATPQTYQLTPVEVKTLLGQNNVFADTGDVSVEYPADTKMYIDNQITALQALVLENISNS